LAGTIKGITIEIAGNTQPLNKSLEGVNTKTKDLQSELKQVERLLKLDPGNTELLAQKQKLLAEAVENSSEKLETLKKAQQQVQEQFNRGEIGEEQYRAFQREVVKAEQELKSFNDQLEKTGKSANDLGDKLNTTGEKMKDVGEKMSVGITAPIVAAGGLMLKGAVDAEVAQGKLQASLGLTADQAADLEAVAQAVWVNGFGENIEEVNQAIMNVRQNMGDLAEDDMQKATEGAMTIADVFDQDVKEVAAAAGVAMKNFGISSQDALDIITYGFQHGGDYSGELLDTIREYSPQFASLGLSADQAMAMLIKGAEAGSWNLDKVGDSMKEFNIRAQDGSKTTADGFAAIGLNAQEMGAAIASGGDEAQKAFVATITALASMKDPVAQNQAGVALFGTQWEDVRSKVITAMADGVTGIDNFKGSTEAASKAASENNPGLALTKSMRELQLAIGPALLPIADIINTTVAPAIKSLADWFVNLSTGGQTAVLVIAGIAAAIGPLLVVVGSAMGLFASLSTIAAGMGLTLTGLLLPIAAVVAAIAAAIAIGVLLYKNWDEIKAKAVEVWDGIKGYLTQTWDSIKQTASEVWNGIKDFFKQWGDEILLLAIGPAGWAVLLGKKIAENWDEIKKTAINIWNDIKTGISNIWSSITSGVSSSVGNVTSAVRNGLENAWDYIKSIPSQALQWGKDIIQGLINGIKSLRLPRINADLGISYKTIAGANIPVPYADLSWYAKGGIFDQPAIIGVGEAGNEAVIPLDRLPGMISDALKQALGQDFATAGGVAVTGNTFYVRNDQDIKLVAQELYNLQQSTARGKGLR
jgi:Phage-related minor tail protein